MCEMIDEEFSRAEKVVREALHFFPECFVHSLRQSTTGSVVVHISCHQTKPGFSRRSNRLVLLRSFLEGRIKDAGFKLDDCSILRDTMTMQLRAKDDTPIHGVIQESRV